MREKVVGGDEGDWGPEKKRKVGGGLARRQRATDVKARDERGVCARPGLPLENRILARADRSLTRQTETGSTPLRLDGQRDDLFAETQRELGHHHHQNHSLRPFAMRPDWTGLLRHSSPLLRALTSP